MKLNELLKVISEETVLKIIDRANKIICFIDVDNQITLNLLEVPVIYIQPEYVNESRLLVCLDILRNEIKS